MPRLSRTTLLAGCAILLWAVFAFPTLQSPHLEGFTAQTQSIALMLSLEPGAAHDPYMPLLTQFIFETRAGVVLLLSQVYASWPGAGDGAYRAVVIGSLMLLIGTSLWFARRTAGIGWASAALALALTPGIVQAAYYFNDNIVAAACASLALCLALRPGVAPGAVAGAVMALAVLCRLDAVLMGPVLLGSVYLSNRARSARAAAAICAMLLAGVAVLLLSAALLGFSVLDALGVASRFTSEHGERWRPFWARVYFFGPVALAALPVGAWLLSRRLDRMQALIWIAYPLMLALCAPKVTETRYVLPMLAPLIAMHGGAAASALFRVDGLGVPKWICAPLAVICLVTLLSPASVVQSMDGPRAFFGRIGNLTQWRTWQDSVHTSQARLREMTGRVENAGTAVVVSSHYNDELYTRLRLIEQGYQPVLAERAFPGCSGFGAFVKGRKRVAHVRTDPQYGVGQISALRSTALQLANYRQCKELMLRPPVFLSTFGSRHPGLNASVFDAGMLKFQAPIDIKFHDPLEFLRPLTGRGYGLIGYRQMTPDELETLDTRVRVLLGATDVSSEISAYLTQYRGQIAPRKPRLASVRNVLGW